MIDSETEEVIERDELVRGYEFAKDRYVTLSDEELSDLKIESSSTMEVEKFVPTDDIPAIYFDKVYYIVPDGDAGIEAFVVVRDAMEKAGMFAISRVVLARKERVIAMKPRGKGIIAYSLREAADIDRRSFSTPWANEAADIKPEQDYFKDIGSAKVDKDMLQIAMKLVQQKSGSFDPADYEDRYERRMRDLIKAKLDGVELEPEETVEEPRVVDLMEALKRSLDGGKTRAPRKDGGSATVHKLKPKAKPKAAKKKAARKTVAKRKRG